MNQKPNDSQTDVKNEDIVIEENTGENKPDVVEGVTAEPNYDTPERKQGFFSTKKGKMVLFGIIGVVILAALIGILVAILKKPDPPDPVPCEGDNCPPVPCEGDHCPPVPCESDNCVVNINYKTNDVYVYDESSTKDSKIELSNDESNLSQASTMNSKYLINIYDNKTVDSVTTYYAYVAIIDMKKKN